MSIPTYLKKKIYTKKNLSVLIKIMNFEPVYVDETLSHLINEDEIKETKWIGGKTISSTIKVENGIIVSIRAKNGKDIKRSFLYSKYDSVERM